MEQTPGTPDSSLGAMDRDTERCFGYFLCLFRTGAQHSSTPSPIFVFEVNSSPALSTQTVSAELGPGVEVGKEWFLSPMLASLGWVWGEVGKSPAGGKVHPAFDKTSLLQIRNTS